MPGATGGTRPKRTTVPTKVTGGSNPRQGSSKTQQTNMKNDEKISAERRVVILGRENMMLRKNLNILEQKLQQYELKVVGGHVSDLQTEIETGREKIKSLENELIEKTKMIKEKDRDLREAKSNIQAQKDNARTSESALKSELETKRNELETVKRYLKNTELELDRHINKISGTLGKRHSSDSTDKMKELQTKCDMFEKIIKEKDKELRKARTEIEEHNCLKFVTKKQLEELEKENSRLKKDIPVRETEIQKLKKELKVTEQAKVKERDSENNRNLREAERRELKEKTDEIMLLNKELLDLKRQQAGNTIKENTEEIARLKNDLLEIKRYCKDVFEKLDQKDKMISQLQEKLNIPTGERNPTPTTRYGAVSKTDTLQFLSR